jgi:hypothetical protein
MADTYLLRVRLEFDKQQQLESAVLTQDISLGDM